MRLVISSNLGPS